MGLGANRVRISDTAAQGSDLPLDSRSPARSRRGPPRGALVARIPPGLLSAGDRALVGPSQLPAFQRVSSLRIRLERITDTPLELAFEASPAWWREHCGTQHDLGADLVAPLAISVRAHRMLDDLYLEGKIEGQAEFVCGRCLTRYGAPIRESFRLVLEPAGSRVPADPEGAEGLARDGLYLSEELETGWFQGDEIRLDPFIREVLALVVPVQPLCREDCRGLCPQCGIDRNTESCECQEQRVASPFAILEKLRTPKP